MKILYCEDEHGVVIEKSIDQITKFLINTDFRQTLNLHRKIKVYKVNFDTKKLSDDCIINLFKTSKIERIKELFTELY